MSKNILFRGQTRKKGEKVTMSGTPIPSNWVFGGIFPQNNGGDFAIIYQQDPEIQKFPVYAETVCQYTGKMISTAEKFSKTTSLPMWQISTQAMFRAREMFSTVKPLPPIWSPLRLMLRIVLTGTMIRA